jgi:hypothetical protein
VYLLGLAHLVIHIEHPRPACLGLASLLELLERLDRHSLPKELRPGDCAWVLSA